MANQREEIELVASDKTKAATDSANKNIKSVETTSEGAAEAVTKSIKSQSDAIVTHTSTSEKRINAILARLKQRTALLDSPMTRLMSQRQDTLKKVGGDPRAVEETNRQFDRLIQNQKNLDATAASDKRAKQARELNDLFAEQKRRIDALRSAEELRDDRRKQMLWQAREPVARGGLQKMFDQEDSLRQQQFNQNAYRNANKQGVSDDLRVRAMFAQATKDAQQAIQQRQNIVTRVTTQAQSPLERLEGQRTKDIAALQGYAAEIDKVTLAYDRLIAKQKQANAREWAQDLYRFGQAATLGITLPLIGAAVAAVSAEQQITKARIALTVMTGSAEQAATMLAELKEFALSTPFEFKELVPQAQRLKALGFEAKAVIPILRAVGEATAGVGGNADTLDRVTLALGQMQSKGRIMAQEMNQLTEALVPAWDILTDKMNVSRSTLMKMIEEGQVAASTAVPMLLKGMFERFYGTMEQQNKEIAGQISNLQDKVFFLRDEMGKALKPAASYVVQFGTTVVDWLGKSIVFFDMLPPSVQKVIFVVGALAAALGPLAVAISGVSRALAVLYGIEAMQGGGILLKWLGNAKAAFKLVGEGASVFDAILLLLPPTLVKVGTAILQWFGPFAAAVATIQVLMRMYDEVENRSLDVADASGHRGSAGGDAMKARAEAGIKEWNKWGKSMDSVIEQARKMHDELLKLSEGQMDLQQNNDSAEAWRDRLKPALDFYKAIDAIRHPKDDPEANAKKIANQELSARRQMQEALAQQLDPISRIRLETQRTMEELAKETPLTAKTIAMLKVKEAVLIAAQKRQVDLAMQAEARDSAVSRAGIKLSTAHQAALDELSGRRSETIPQQLEIEEERGQIEAKFAKDRTRNEQQALYERTVTQLRAEAMTGQQRSAIRQKYVNDWTALELRGTAEAESAAVQSQNRITALRRQHELEILRMHQDTNRQRMEMAQGPIDQDKRIADAQVAMQSVGAVTIQEKIALEQQKLAIENSYTQRSADLQESIRKQQLKDDLQLVGNDFEKRFELIDRYNADRERAEQDTTAKIQQTQIDAALHTAEIIQQVNRETFNTFKQEANSALDAMLRKGQNVFVALGTFIKASFFTAFKDIASNQIAKFMTQLTTGDQVTLKSPGRGGILGGVFGKLGLGSIPVFSSKRYPMDEKLPQGMPVTARLTAPNGISDWRMVGGAMPVVIQGMGPQVATKAITAAGAFSLGGLLMSGARTASLGAADSRVISYGDAAADASGLGPSIPGFGQNGIYQGTDVPWSENPTAAASAQQGALGKLGGLGQLASGYKGILGALTKLGNLGRGTGMIPRGIGGVTGGLMLAGGGVLAFDGLRRGGVTGLAETTAGGALIGAKFGGPLGALIGGAVGLGAGLIRLSIKGAPEKIIEKVKAIYGITIDKPFAQQLAKRIHDNYGGDIDLGIRAPEIRNLLQLYAQSRLTTEDASKFPLAYQPYDVGVKLSGGQMTQTAAMVNGSAIAYGGGTLGTSGPVNKLITGTQQGAFMPSTLVVQNLSLSLNGQSAVDAMTGAVASNPEVVGNASLAANNQRVGGRATQASLTPGLITG